VTEGSPIEALSDLSDEPRNTTVEEDLSTFTKPRGCVELIDGFGERFLDFLAARHVLANDELFVNFSSDIERERVALTS